MGFAPNPTRDQGSQRDSKATKLSYLDATRGFAITAVIFYHVAAYGTNDFGPVLRTIFLLGSHGVQLFFIASAFTLFMSYHNRKNQATGTTRNFFIRRYFRIAPMYGIAIVYYLSVNGLGPNAFLGDANGVSTANIIANATLFNGISPYWMSSVVPGGWSIGCEMIFYILLPFLVTRIVNLNHSVLFTVVALVGSLISVYLLGVFPFIQHDRLWFEFTKFSIIGQLPVFGFGIIGYFLLIKKDYHISPYLLFMIAALFITEMSVDNFIPFHTLMGVPLLAILVGLSFQPPGWINSRAIRLIGKISFSMYLVHFAVIAGMQYLNFVDYLPGNSKSIFLINYTLRFMITMSVTVMISFFTYELIEKRFVRYGSLLIKYLGSSSPGT